MPKRRPDTDIKRLEQAHARELARLERAHARELKKLEKRYERELAKELKLAQKEADKELRALERASARELLKIEREANKELKRQEKEYNKYILNQIKENDKIENSIIKLQEENKLLDEELKKSSSRIKKITTSRDRTRDLIKKSLDDLCSRYGCSYITQSGANGLSIRVSFKTIEALRDSLDALDDIKLRVVSCGVHVNVTEIGMGSASFSTSNIAWTSSYYGETRVFTAYSTLSEILMPALLEWAGEIDINKTFTSYVIRMTDGFFDRKK
jgi:small-conductance mechanosensitive channel